MRTSVLVLCLLLFSGFAFGQATVTLQVTDASSQSWNNGTYTASLLPAAGNVNNPPPFYVNGVQLTPAQIKLTGSLNGTGGATLTQYQNTSITPSGSYWLYVVCPQATSGCYQSLATTISGSTQTVTLTPPAISLVPGPTVAVYSTSEVGNAQLGSQVYVIGTGVEVCTALTGNTCATWASTGGAAFPVTSAVTVGNGGSISVTGSGSIAGVGTAAPLVSTVYLSPACPTGATTGPCIYTPANTVIEQACTNWTTSSNQIVCPNAAFLTTAHIGDYAMGASTCDPDHTIPVGGIITTTHVTITGITNNTTLTISSNPANASTGTTACFVHGTADDAGAAFADTVLQGATQCSKLELAAASYFFTTFHFITNPTACQNLGAQYPNAASQGNLVLANGMEVQGRGPGVTNIYIPADFPESGSCVNGQDVASCFSMPLESHFDGFTIISVGDLGVPANKTLISEQIGELDFFACYNVGGNSSGSIGLKVTYWAVGRNVNLSSCGQTNMFANGGATGQNGKFHFTNLSLETGSLAGSSGASNLEIYSGTFTCDWCWFLGTESSLNTPIDIRVGSSNSASNSLFCYQCQIWETSVGATTPVGIRLVGTGNDLIHLQDTAFNNYTYPNTGFYGIQNSMTAGHAYVQLDNVQLVHGSSANSIIDATAGLGTYVLTNNLTFIDPTGWSITGGSNVVADGHSLLATCTGVVNASVTNSLYGTGPNVTGTTCASQTTTIGTGTVVPYNAVLSSLFCTSTATTVSVACKVMVNGAASTITCTMTASKACQDFTHTVALTPGSLVSAEITTGAAETGAGITLFVLWQQQAQVEF